MTTDADAKTMTDKEASLHLGSGRDTFATGTHLMNSINEEIIQNPDDSKQDLDTKRRMNIIDDGEDASN